MGGDGTVEAKRVARRAARARRADLVAQVDPRWEAERVAVFGLAVVQAHAPERATVAAYASYGTEPPTGRLLQTLTEAGYDVLLPLLRDDRSLDWSGPDGRPRGALAVSVASVVLTPALAVDRSGTRLGQGGGSYDRALTRCRPDALVVALLHDGELLPAGILPHDEHDIPVHGVITPDSHEDLRRG